MSHHCRYISCAEHYNGGNAARLDRWTRRSAPRFQRGVSARAADISPVLNWRGEAPLTSVCAHAAERPLCRGETQIRRGVIAKGPVAGALRSHMLSGKQLIGPSVRALFYLSLTFFCVHAAQRLASQRHRSQKAWMWAAALLGPLPLPVLAWLPQRRSSV